MIDAIRMEEASKLLLDPNLVWSDDFEAVRVDLGNWLRSEANSVYCLIKEPSIFAVGLTETLLGGTQ